MRTGVAAVVAVALLAAACGDDNGGTAAPDESAEDGPTGGGSSDDAPDEDADGVVAVAVDEAALQTLLDDWRTEVDSFGATLSIRLPGHDDIHLASGVDDRDTTALAPDGSAIEGVEHSETPMPADGTYQIMDLTRSFVAAIALQLVDEGRLSLDDPVERWVPELPNADEITVAMLLGNTSGLGSWYGPTSPDSDADFIATLQADWARSFTPEEVLAEHLERPPLERPGERFVWSDADYHALGMLIERELAKEIATVIEERLTGPLALDDTTLSDDFQAGTRHAWFTYGDADDPFDILDLPSGTALATSLWVGHGAMISSSRDLLDWGAALYSGDVLGDETTETMLDMRGSFTPPIFIGQPDTDGSVHYGLGAMGFCIEETGCTADDAMEIVGHSGAWGPNVNLLAHHRDSGMTVMVNANTYPAPSVPQRFSLVADVLELLGLA